VGLDSIAVILATEEVFNIEIPDEAAERIGTVRELAAYVAGRVPRVRGRECRTQRMLYRTRRVLGRLRVPREAVRPSAMLLTLKPALAHPEVWPLFGKALGASVWPALPVSYPWRRLTPKTTLPYGLRTPGEVARHLATAEFRPMKGTRVAWTTEEVLLRVRQVVSEQLEISAFPDDAHLVNDLGVG
jgi:hypothetical protein